MKVSMLERKGLTKKRAYYMSSFVDSLREGKGFMIDASGLRNHIGRGREWPLSHVVILMMRIFKGENGSINHLKKFVKNTDSKLNVR